MRRIQRLAAPSTKHAVSATVAILCRPRFMTATPIVRVVAQPQQPQPPQAAASSQIPPEKPQQAVAADSATTADATSEKPIAAAPTATTEQSTTSATTNVDATTGKPLSLKKKLALYGSGGLLLYIIIHDIFLFFIFTGMYVLGLDLVGVARSYGFSIIRPAADGAAAAGAEGEEQKRKPSFFATLLTALILTKLFAPIQLTLTLLLAPRFVPLLEPFANRVIPKVKRVLSRLPFRRSQPAAVTAAPAAVTPSAAP